MLLIPRAGHETSGHTLTWVLGYIALFPKVQEEIYKELIEICGDSLPSKLDPQHLIVMQLTVQLTEMCRNSLIPSLRYTKVFDSEISS